MILTVTLNPSVDISYNFKELKINNVNRTKSVIKTAGGKGLNVTRVLSQIDIKVLATGFNGGYLGQFIEHELNKLDISHSFYHVEGETRNCIALIHGDNQTEILEKGPSIKNEEKKGFLNHIQNLLKNVKLVVISGSLPNGLPPTYYSELIKICNAFSVPTVIDCSGEPLKLIVNGDEKPFAIKPNIDELSQLLNRKVSTDLDDLKCALSDEIFRDIDWVFVSLGSHGSFVKYQGRYFKAEIPKINVLNPVGSGDSTVAGFSAAYLNNQTIEDIIKYANTLGILNAMESETGFINKNEIENIFKKIKITEV